MGLTRAIGDFLYVPPIDNEGSTTRDYLARERNFLSFLKLTLSLFTISVALLLCFQAQEIDSPGPRCPQVWRTLAVPLGSLYFATSLVILLAAIISFYSYQDLMKRHAGFVQSGWGTFILVTWITVVVGAGCILVLYEVA